MFPDQTEWFSKIAIEKFGATHFAIKENKSILLYQINEVEEPNSYEQARESVVAYFANLTKQERVALFDHLNSFYR